MPIEIKELHIKATVVDKKQGRVSGELSPAERDKLKKELVKACVQEVLQILDDKRER